ncbi:MAG: 30S ribosomal protein S4 [Patescibacteria group bacterium]|nr:30S ribosomal protein S4 [Patescibacteria group bacterium]
MKQPVCRKCRREGLKLFLKGERCFSAKCAFIRRSYSPGTQGQGKFSKLSEYGKQLREKQKTKRIYGVREAQFVNYFSKASKNKQATGDALIQLLEKRLDNAVYKLGFTSSLRQARQNVSHGLYLVNGKKINIPSYSLGVKDIVEPRQKDNFKLIKTDVPAWLKLDNKKIKGEVVSEPEKDSFPKDINADLIVEFYSR